MELVVLKEPSGLRGTLLTTSWPWDELKTCPCFQCIPPSILTLNFQDRFMVSWNARRIISNNWQLFKNYLFGAKIQKLIQLWLYEGRTNGLAVLSCWYLKMSLCDLNYLLAYFCNSCITQVWKLFVKCWKWFFSGVLWQQKPYRVWWWWINFGNLVAI